MSAWLVSEFHINALVSYAKREGVPFVHASTQEEMARILVDENMRSLNHRYEDTEEWTKDAATYRFQPVSQEELKTFIKRKVAERSAKVPGMFSKLPPMYENVVATQIIKACDCYDYQACETDDYEDTKAHDFIHLVRECAIKLGGQEHGKLNDAMLWGLD